jgi:very-short-patch-repair endonuclease
MKKRWIDKDLANLVKKGLTVEEQIKHNSGEIAIIKKTPQVSKSSIGKNTIELLLKEMKTLGIITNYVTELKFDEVRRFRFDWAIPDIKLAIEYEGLNSEKSRHTTKKGYAQDCEKYNLATINGWKILRYTALNYSNFSQDIKVFLRKL